MTWTEITLATALYLTIVLGWTWLLDQKRKRKQRREDRSQDERQV